MALGKRLDFLEPCVIHLTKGASWALKRVKMDYRGLGKGVRNAPVLCKCWGLFLEKGLSDLIPQHASTHQA